MRFQPFVATGLAAALAGAIGVTPAGAETPIAASLRGLAPRAQSRIVGGEQTSADDWPWQVFVVIPKKKKGEIGLCGAR